MIPLVLKIGLVNITHSPNNAGRERDNTLFIRDQKSTSTEKQPASHHTLRVHQTLHTAPKNAIISPPLYPPPHHHNALGHHPPSAACFPSEVYFMAEFGARFMGPKPTGLFSSCQQNKQVPGPMCPPWYWGPFYSVESIGGDSFRSTQRIPVTFAFTT